MTRLRRRQMLVIATSPTLVNLPRPARAAEGFPQHAIRFICPFPVGGATDRVSRALANAAATQLGVPVVVENKPGANGVMGARAMRHASPDGHVITLLLRGLYRPMESPGFHPINDLTHIVALGKLAFCLIVRRDAPFVGLREMMAWARGHPGRLTFGHTGEGTSPYTAMRAISERTKVEFNEIPYKGSADSQLAVITGQIDAVVTTMEIKPMAAQGMVRLAAVFSEQRLATLPDVPTAIELGVAVEVDSPFGIGGPKDMAPEVVKILSAAFRASRESAEVQTLYRQLDLISVSMDSAEYTRWAVKTFKAEHLKRPLDESSL